MCGENLGRFDSYSSSSSILTTLSLNFENDPHLGYGLSITTFNYWIGPKIFVRYLLILDLHCHLKFQIKLGRGYRSVQNIIR